jgi:cupin 2 domain-containing protein
MESKHGNLLRPLPAAGHDEALQTLLARPGVRIERIVSHGQVSPPGFWYAQHEDEWVLLAAGEAALEYGDGRTVELAAGDWLLIPAGERHRVARTSSPAVWLAVFVAAA